MKVSLNWLKDYVKFDLSDRDYAELMNRNGVYRDQEAENEKTHMCRMDKLAHELIR